MKKTIALFVLLALCAALLTACGGQTAETKPEPTPEPTPVIYTGEDVPNLTMKARDDDAPFSQVICQPSVYGWSWPAEDGVFQGVEACGVGPTDPILTEYLDYIPLEQPMAVTLSWPEFPPDGVSVVSWEIGVYELPAGAAQDGYLRDAGLTAGETGGERLLTLEPNRVYDVYADWTESEECSFGNAHYYILTRNDSQAAPVLVGGWDIEDATGISEELRTAFDKAVEDMTGVGYEPVACLGRQTVAGTNYALLCRAQAVYPDAQPYYAVVVLYTDLTGGARIRDIVSLTPWGEPDENASAGQPLAGGWSVLESQEECLAAVEDAAGRLLGASYEYVWGLSSQVVAGRNYWALCRTRAVTPEARKAYTLVKVYVDLNGNASVTETAEWDLAGILSAAEG